MITWKHLRQQYLITIIILFICPAWMDYQIKFDRLQKTATTEEARRLYFSELEAAFYKVKTTADEILAINQDAMVRKSDAVRRTAERMNTITLIVALTALLLGLVVSMLLTRRMLKPVSALSEATRKIGEGNFDARAHVRGNDELAQLARDFNAMAGRLGEYRKSSLGELLQAHLSMQAAIDCTWARTSCEPRIRSSSLKRASLSCGFSVAASMTRSASGTSSSPGAVRISSAADFCSAVIAPLLAIFSTERAIVCLARSSCSGTTSIITTR